MYNQTVKLNNDIASRCESAMHLGHMLYTVNASKELTKHAIKDLKKSYYSFISIFDTCYTTSNNKLFHQYCRAIYGSQLWDMTSPKVDKMYTQWRKAHTTSARTTIYDTL